MRQLEIEKPIKRILLVIAVMIMICVTPFSYSYCVCPDTEIIGTKLSVLSAIELDGLSTAESTVFEVMNIEMPEREVEGTETELEQIRTESIQLKKVITCEKIKPAFGDYVVEIAEQYLGVPYVYGGTSPYGFDCSGFVYYVFNEAGYPLSRSMRAQYNAGTIVSKDELQPGDIVFFQNTYVSGMSHVGIYVGDGQFIHAPSSGKVVSYADLNSDYYISHYYSACRIQNHN